MNHNKMLQNMFSLMGNILEFQKESPFKFQAYKRATKVIKGLREDIAALDRRGELEKLPSIGPAIAKKIHEFLNTGMMSKFEEIKDSVSEDMVELLSLPELDGRTLFLLNKKAPVKTKSVLKKLLDEGVFDHVPGVKPEKIQRLKDRNKFLS